MAIFNGWRITRTGIIFVAGLIILAGLVFGGIYLVSQRGEQARREEAIAVAEQNLQQQPEPIAQEESEAETNTGAISVNEEAEEQPEALPETGTGLTSLLAVTLLALAAGYYAQSRRTVRDL